MGCTDLFVHVAYYDRHCGGLITFLAALASRALYSTSQANVGSQVEGGSSGGSQPLHARAGDRDDAEDGEEAGVDRSGLGGFAPEERLDAMARCYPVEVRVTVWCRRYLCGAAPT